MMGKRRWFHHGHANQAIHECIDRLEWLALDLSQSDKQHNRVVQAFNIARCDITEVLWDFNATWASRNAVERFDIKRQSERMNARLARLMKPTTRARMFNAQGHFVYQIIDANDTPVYIGMSSNLMNRLGAHASDKRKQPHTAKVKFVEVASREEAAELEGRLIAHFQPALNTHKKAA